MKKKTSYAANLVIFIGMIFGSFSFGKGDLDFSPEGFSYKTGKAIFVDLKSVKLKLVLNPSSKDTNIEAEITFSTAEAGYPLINLPSRPTVKMLKLDGKKLNIGEFVPVAPKTDPTWSLRPLPELTTAGKHTLNIEYSLAETFKLMDFNSEEGTVDFFPIMDDFFSRGPDFNQGYIEVAFPTNLQYDAYSFSLSLSVASEVPHTVRTNGKLKETGTNEFLVDFPRTFTANSFYLHIFPKRDLEQHNDLFATVKSIDGRSIPIEVYCDKAMDYCQEMKEKLIDHFSVMEKQLGAYPFSKLLARITMRYYGMEYSGAFTANDGSLKHEINHNWYGRCLSPMSGRDGWIDEAVATWSEGFRKAKVADLSDVPPNASGHDLTMSKRYDLDSTQFSYMANQMLEKFDKLFETSGGLAPRLKEFLKKGGCRRITTEEFHRFLAAQKEWNAESEKVFQFYVYGKR